jgi:hypothetical protein
LQELLRSIASIVVAFALVAETAHAKSTRRPNRQSVSTVISVKPAANRSYDWCIDIGKGGGMAARRRPLHEKPRSRLSQRFQNPRFAHKIVQMAERVEAKPTIHDMVLNSNTSRPPSGSQRAEAR